jgi:ubiquinone/menaquinone biosynthesis C-methylase UbiE/uncharacterized protein YbaR (Trm112 family)
MHEPALNLLRCPSCGARLTPRDGATNAASEVELSCEQEGRAFPVRDGIPRFVDSDSYAESFGFQWQRFDKVQLDSHNQTRFSEERFTAITGWGDAGLRGHLVLDAGCGAGRFAEVVAAKYGARLVAMDLSRAVDACAANLHPAPFLVCQASLLQPPFTNATFDFVYCIGVIQHTPDPERAVRALCRLVKPGGRIGLWIYERDWKSYLGTLGFKWLLRPVVCRLRRGIQLKLCELLVAVFFPVLWPLKRLGWPGKVVMRLLPVASAHLQHVPLTKNLFRDWLVLDTFDMYSPVYDQPQRFETVRRILEDEGFTDLCRHPHGGIAVTALREG